MYVEYYCFTGIKKRGKDVPVKHTLCGNGLRNKNHRHTLRVRTYHIRLSHILIVFTSIPQYRTVRYRYRYKSVVKQILVIVSCLNNWPQLSQAV